MAKDRNFVVDAFLKLTDHTYPHGTEELLVKKMKADGIFPEGARADRHGNYIVEVGQSRTVFTSHLDTVSRAYSPVSHVFDGDTVRTDGTTTLGADDKAGVAIMLWMIKNRVPGVYYFFVGEEVGCVGSGRAASAASDFRGKYDRMISFDRRGTDSVITHQSYSRSCSDAFARALAAGLNSACAGFGFAPDDTGIYTDSAEFTDIIPECTNISVGYYKEHSHAEHQDLAHLRRLADACLLVCWDALPTERVAGEEDYSYGFSYAKTYDTKSSSSSSYGSWGRKTGSSWRKYDRWSDDRWDDDDDWHFLKTEKKGAPKPKKYYDDGGDLVEFGEERGRYSHVMSKFSGRIDDADLEVIREQYLDMNDYNDIVFYEYLLDYVSGKAI